MASVHVKSAMEEDSSYTIHVDSTQPEASFAPPTVLPVSDADGGKWEASFTDCCAAPAHCILAVCIPCASAADIAHSFGGSAWMAGIVIGALFVLDIVFSILYATSSPDYHYDAYYDSWSHDNKWKTKYSVAACICSVLFGVAVTYLRTATRRFARIEGSCVVDCCAAFWCTWCTLGQMSLHVERLRTQATAQKLARNTLPAYK